MAAITICSDFGAPQNKVWHCFHCFTIYFPWNDGTNVITCHQRVELCSQEMMPFSAFNTVSILGVLGTQQWLLSVFLNPYRFLTYPSCKVCFVNKPMTRERGWLISTPQIFLSTWLVRNSFSWKPLCEIHLDKNILIPSTHSEIVVIVIQAFSNVQLFATQWTAACQAFLSFTISWGFSNSCPLSQWCHPTISSSVALFSSLQSSPASGSFPMSLFFTSGGQSIGASTSVVPMNTQGWFPLGLTGLISLLSNRLSRVFSNTTIHKPEFFGAQPSLCPVLTSIQDY